MSEIMAFLAYNSVYLVPAIFSLGLGVLLITYAKKKKENLSRRKYQVLMLSGVLLTFLIPGLLLYYSILRGGGIEKEVTCYIAIPTEMTASPALLTLREKYRDKYKELIRGK